MSVHNDDELKAFVIKIRSASPYEYLPAEYQSESAVPAEMYDAALAEMLKDLAGLILEREKLARLSELEGVNYIYTGGKGTKRLLKAKDEVLSGYLDHRIAQLQPTNEETDATDIDGGTNKETGGDHGKES